MDAVFTLADEERELSAGLRALPSECYWEAVGAIAILLYRYYIAFVSAEGRVLVGRTLGKEMSTPVWASCDSVELIRLDAEWTKFEGGPTLDFSHPGICDFMMFLWFLGQERMDSVEGQPNFYAALEWVPGAVISLATMNQRHLHVGITKVEYVADLPFDSPERVILRQLLAIVEISHSKSRSGDHVTAEELVRSVTQ